MGAAELLICTEAEYLAMDRAAEERHEFMDGEVFSMAGGSLMHDRITFNLTALLRSTLRGRPCRGYTSNMRVKGGPNYVYPDATIVCGPSQIQDYDILLNPKVVFEVLSPSTEGYDRGRKFAFYRNLESLQECVLIAQDEAMVEHYVRESDGKWTLQSYGPGDVLRLPSVDIKIPIDELYEGVQNESEFYEHKS